MLRIKRITSEENSVKKSESKSMKGSIVLGWFFRDYFFEPENSRPNQPLDD